MDYPNEFELWRLHRDELAREIARERLARRPQAARQQGGAKNPTQATEVRRGGHYVRGIGRKVRVSPSEKAES